ncbi:probable ATP-dependent RNA helicase DDX49 [Sceloporus undulatus]|uniref:probable ATP-dependent RNA helicase DDX49 n=1 Tax=Sceloporus undulatus TaxID=8520 RepID=UPI001C4BC6E7|nr:probable ATP-dependent RNA helicase DDX49 [Sceloporus undulatus]
MAGFRALGLAPWLAAQAEQLGLKAPTPVQEACIPPALRGRDCMGCAKTGSGKTAAFVLPILQKLSEDPYGVFCLVLTPTRELAYQIAEQFRVLGKPLGLKDCIIVGGMDMVTQALELSRKPHVVIATPGRLADHLRSSNTFSLQKIKFLVLDEADRLLEQGCTDFTKDLEVILAAVPAKRQTMLFSATLTDTLNELKQIAMNKPFFWESTSDSWEDGGTGRRAFPECLRTWISHLCKGVHLSDTMLASLATPHCKGGRKSNSICLTFLVFSLPGRHGIAITLVTQYDIHLVHAIEEQIKMKLQEYSVEERDVLSILTQVNVVRRECEIRLEATDFDEKKEINKRKQMILDGKDPDLEEKRRAELAKIKKKNGEFRSKVQQTLQERQQLQLRQKLQKRKSRQQQKQAVAGKEASAPLLQPVVGSEEQEML